MTFTAKGVSRSSSHYTLDEDEELVSVTAEAAGSSPVVPAILSKKSCSDFTETTEDPKGHVFVPFFVSLLAALSRQGFITLRHWQPGTATFR
jgi:hypothetical protein